MYKRQVLHADGSLRHVELSTQREFQAMLRGHQAVGLVEGDKEVYHLDRLKDGVQYRPITVRPPLQRGVYISHPRPALVSWCPSATQPAGFVLQVVPESRRVKRNITIVSEAPAGAEPSESRYPKLDRQTWDRMLNMHGKPGVESAEEPGVVLRWEALTDGGTYYVPQDGAARARMKRVRAGSQHA